MKEKISVIMVVYNEEKLIRRCLDSVKDIADEILVLHDGPCSDNTLKLAREYTSKVFKTKKNVGVPGPILPILFRKVKYPWILKIDADEFLSQELKENITRLVKNPKADAYSFIWPYWDGKKHITKNWPRKTSLYRKSKISYFGFPHWDEPKINGNVVKTEFVLEHRQLQGAIPTLKMFKEKILGRYARLHAEYTLKKFETFDSFQYKEKNFPAYIRIRRDYPLFSMIPLTIAATLKILFSPGAWKEGSPIFSEMMQSLIYYPYVNYLIYKLKKKQKSKI